MLWCSGAHRSHRLCTDDARPGEARGEEWALHHVHLVVQPLVPVLAELRTGLVLPQYCNQPRFLSTFELPQQALGNVIITTAGIGPVKHEGIDIHTKFIACLSGVLKPFHRWRHRPVGFDEDGMQAGKETCLQVAHAS